MIQLLSAAALQRMNKKKNEKKNEKMINVGEKSTENVKIKKVVEKRFSKEKEKSDIIMFEVIDVKDLNAEIFMKYHIDDTTTISSSFTKFSFEFKDFSRKENAAQTYGKKQKKEENSKKNEKKNFDKAKKKKTDE